MEQAQVPTLRSDLAVNLNLNRQNASPLWTAYLYGKASRKTVSFDQLRN
jgi:hypothetical protein